MDLNGTLHLDLPERTEKPRDTGISNLVDNGYGLRQLDDILSFCHPFVDVVKLGWGSAYLTTQLREKVELFSRYGIRTCPGGLMFELAFWQDRIDEYAAFLEEHGIGMVEVSNGSLPIPEPDKKRMVEWFARRGFTVLSEVGGKDVNRVSPPGVWVRAIRDDLAAGAWKTITEGRADASAGIYTGDGTVREEIVEAILDAGIPASDLVFEAPRKPVMVWFIQRVGPDVNIGNVPLDQVMNLETLRRGLRGDTVGTFHGTRRPARSGAVTGV